MDDNNKKPNKVNMPKFNLNWMYMIIALMLLGLWWSNQGGTVSKQVPYDEFQQYVRDGYVNKVVGYDDSSVEVYIKPQFVGQVFKQDSNRVGKNPMIVTEAPTRESLGNFIDAEKKEGHFDGSISYDKKNNLFNSILINFLPIIFLIALWIFFMRRMSGGAGGGGGGVFNVGKSKAQLFEKGSAIKITFKDVAGLAEAKQEVEEIVEFLKQPQKYTDLGGKIPKGALLVGPPGTGKTLLAKAVAGEANVPFFSLAGSDFVEMFVGVGASRVRDLFKEAQKQAPCIIFIDEIDAIGKSRDSRYGGGNDEREQTLNQLLAEMDGFDSSKGLFILAATNRPEVLDKALLRPGRFDRRIIVDKPDLKGRIDTLKVHSKDVLMDDTVDLEAIGLATSGAVGSDLANMINEAAIAAVKDGRKVVSQKDLFEAVEVVIAGKEKKDRILSKEEKRTVAYHEVGHALITALKKNAEPVQKITIVPRTMGSLGYVMQVPEEEKYLMTKDELMTRLVTLLGGRAAEEVVFDTVTTGASNDIEKATQIARAMITQYGMSEKFGLMSLETVESKYLDGSARLNCSDETAAMIDDEVKELLKECFAEAKKLLSENRDVLDEIAKYLYEKETITGKQFMEIYRKVKGIPEPVDTSHMTISEKVAESVSFNEDGSYSSTVNQAPPAPWEHPQQTEAQQPSPEQTDKDVPTQNTEKEEDRNTEQ